jgi:hypothetical protein
MHQDLTIALILIMVVALVYAKAIVANASKYAAWVRRHAPLWMQRIEPLHDPMNGTDAEHNVGYVSRWSLVEFGVGCTRCGEIAAPRMGFHLIRRCRLPDKSVAEVIDCPHCHTVLVASPTTEKGEHLLPSTPKIARELATFALKKHPLSPMSAMEAHTERMSKDRRTKVKDLVALNPLDHVRYASEQANADKPDTIENATTITVGQPVAASGSEITARYDTIP